MTHTTPPTTTPQATIDIALVGTPSEHNRPVSIAEQRFAFQLHRIDTLQSQLNQLDALRLHFVPLFSASLAPYHRRYHAALAGLIAHLEQRLERGGLSPVQRARITTRLNALRPPAPHAQDPTEPPIQTQQDDTRKEARQRKIAKRLIKKSNTPAGQRNEQLQQTATIRLRRLYRQLASTLHPDREPNETLREQKNAWMSQVNAANDRQDWLALVSLQAKTSAFVSEPVHPPASDDWEALTLLLKKQVADLERHRAQQQKELLDVLQLPANATLSHSAVEQALEMLKADIETACQSLEIEKKR